jgi:hypothetical protein
LTGTTGTFNTRLGVGSYAGSPTLFTSGSGDQEIHFTHSDNIPDRKINLRLTNNNSSYYTYGGLIYALQGDGLNQYNRMTLGVNTTEIMHLTRFSRVGILNNSPSYTLDVNGTFNATGNSLIGGTLGVTGAATFSSSVTGNSFIKSGGTSSQFLKADGTTDSNTYLTTSSAASTYQTILTNPVTGTGANNYLPKFTGASIIGNSVIQESSGNIGIGISPTANLELAKGKFIMLNSREGASQDSAGIMLYETGTKSANDINFGAKIMYNADADNFEIKMKNYNGTTLFNPPVSITIPRTSGDVNIGTALNVTGAATLNNDLVLQTSGARTTTAIRHYYAQQGRYAGEIQFQPSGSSGSLLSFITNQSGFGQTERMRIDELGNVGINDNSPSYTLDVNGTLGVTGAATLSSTLAVTGATTLSTTSATPTALLGKDGSNVVGAVTDISQSGLMKVGSTTQNTSSVGIINVPHGLSYTPTKVIATIAQQNSYVIVCHQITSTNLNFTVYDSTNGAALNNVSVGFFWLAFK